MAIRLMMTVRNWHLWQQANGSRGQTLAEWRATGPIPSLVINQTLRVWREMTSLPSRHRAGAGPLAIPSDQLR